MDIRCKNCGQMIDENDKYCKYCGYLIPQQEKEKPLSQKQLEDKMQEAKATISEEDIVSAQTWAFEDLKIKKVGDRKSLYTKNICISVLCLMLMIGCVVGAFLVKSLVENKQVALVCLMLFMFCMLTAMGFTIEKFFNTKALKNITETNITVKKYGFKKPAEFMIGGYVFEVVVQKSCPLCEGEIIGDLHIEIIEKKPVVVCNINRKHCWIIEEKDFLQKARQGEIEIIPSKKEKQNDKTN